ncbi:hypothetical protein WJ970_32370 [Achromobacter xylosoxidans]
MGAFSTPALAQYQQQLGPLAGAVQQQMLQGWTAGVEDGWFTLRNTSTPGSEQTLYMNVGPAPESGRVTDVNVVVKSPNPKASIGVVLNNRANKSLCLLELTVDKNTLLFCLQGDKRRDIASVPNVAKLDGSDRIRVVELPGAARFIVNGQKIGDVRDEPATGSQIGIMAYDVGTFGIADFAVTEGQADAKPAPPRAACPRAVVAVGAAAAAAAAVAARRATRPGSKAAPIRPCGARARIRASAATTCASCRCTSASCAASSCTSSVTR